MEHGVNWEVGTLERHLKPNRQGSAWYFQTTGDTAIEVGLKLASSLQKLYDDGWRVKTSLVWAEIPTVILERSSLTTWNSEKAVMLHQAANDLALSTVR